jgi:predicted MFS family arabinose efflux permease
MLTMGYAISSLIGPLVVGYSVEYMGHPSTYLVLAAVTLVPIALFCIKRLIPVAPIVPGPRGERSFMDLVRIPRLRAMFIASGVCVTGWDLFTFYMPIYGRSISLSASTIGEIIAMFGIASFVARFAMPAATRRFREEQLLAASLYLAAGTFALFPFVHNVPGLMLLAFIMGLGLGCGQPLTMMLTYTRSPEGRAGEANGLRQMANNVTHIFVPLFFGAIGSAFGLTPVFWTNTVFLAVGGYFSRR